MPVILVSLLLSACQPPWAPTHSVSVSSASPTPTVPRLPSLSSPTPFKLDEVAVRDTMKRWIDAYNAREEQAFLAYLGDKKIMYADCDYSARRLFEGRERREVLAWIRQRWALDDRFELYDVRLISGLSGGPPSQPGEPIGGVGLRIHRSIRELPNGENMAPKVIFNGLDGRGSWDGNTTTEGIITTVAFGDYIACPRGNVYTGPFK